MEARFAALEKSVFHLLKQIGAPGERRQPRHWWQVWVEGSPSATLAAPPCLTPISQSPAAEPLPTKRRIGYSCGPKGKGKAASLQAAASDSSAATASVAALALAMPAVSQAAAH